MSLKISVPHTPVDGPKAPRCDSSTDEEFAESSDDNFIASDNEETFTEADPTNLTKEGATFVMGTHHAVNTYDKWHPTSEQDKSLKIKILEIENTEIKRTVQHLEIKLAEIQVKHDQKTGWQELMINSLEVQLSACQEKYRRLRIRTP